MAPMLFRGRSRLRRESVRTDWDVLVIDGTIAQVGGQAQAPTDAKVINASGRTVLPGLIDSHTHTKPPALEMALTFGVTTELDMLVDYGSSVGAALRSPTLLPAKRFSLGDRGRIAPGLQADLLLVEGDPTTDVRQTLPIEGISRRGEKAPRIVQAGRDSFALADARAGS